MSVQMRNRFQKKEIDMRKSSDVGGRGGMKKEEDNELKEKLFI